MSLPTLSLLGCFLILCHYFKKLEPVTMLEGVAENYATRNRATSALSPLNSSSSRPIHSLKGRKSPVPKLLSETELQSQNWGWIDWIWWTAFNFSIGKTYISACFLCVFTIDLLNNASLQITLFSGLVS